MIVATIGNYIRLWQVPVFMGFVAAWLAGGPWLMRWGLRGRRQQGQAKLPWRRRAQVNLLANGAGIGALCIVALLFLALAARVGPRALALGAAVLGPLAMVGMSWLVHATMLGNTTRQLLPVAAASAGPLAGVLLMVILASVGPVYLDRLEAGKLGTCAEKLNRLASAIEQRARTRHGAPLTNLQTLVDEGLLESEALCCPGNPKRPVGYLCQPCELVGRNETTKTILVCDRRGNHAGKRQVVLANGSQLAMAEELFQEYLAEPGNAALAQADAADK